MSQQESGLRSLAELADEMRDFVDLPIQDLARMAGLGRRRYYALLQGEAGAIETPEEGARVRRLYDRLKQIYTSLGQDPRAVCEAVLMPLPLEDQSSWFFIMSTQATEQDEQRAYELLISLLDRVGSASYRTLPPSGIPGNPDWSEAADFLAE